MHIFFSWALDSKNGCRCCLQDWPAMWCGCVYGYHSGNCFTALVLIFGSKFAAQKFSSRYFVKVARTRADPDSCSWANLGNHGFVIREGCLKPHSRSHKVICVAFLAHGACPRGLARKARPWGRPKGPKVGHVGSPPVRPARKARPWCRPKGRP